MQRCTRTYTVWLFTGGYGGRISIPANSKKEAKKYLLDYGCENQGDDGFFIEDNHTYFQIREDVYKNGGLS